MSVIPTDLNFSLHTIGRASRARGWCWFNEVSKELASTGNGWDSVKRLERHGLVRTGPEVGHIKLTDAGRQARGAFRAFE